MTKYLFKDHGLFLCLAQRVARDGIEVFYHTANWENGAPTPEKDHFGFGLPGITVVDTFDDCIMEDKPDYLIYPDVGFGGEQVRERLLGNNVFGSGYGEILEDDRIYFRELLKKKKLPYSPYIQAHGIDDLREKLKKVQDKYVKISLYRGLCETFHFTNYEESQPDINDLANKLGLLDKEVDILIADPIPTYIENIGLEVFVTDEGFLPTIILGIESKDSGYIGKLIEYKDTPKPIKSIADSFLPVYKSYKIRGAISLEGHMTEKNVFYYDDPCQRFGSPPGESICEAYTNLPQMMEGVAKGRVIKPEFKEKYIAEVMLKIREPRRCDIVLDISEKDLEFIKIRYLCKLGKKLVHLGQDKETVLGAAVGKGNSPKEAMDMALNMAKKVKGSGIYYDSDCFDNLDEQMRKVKKLGWDKF